MDLINILFTAAGGGVFGIVGGLIGKFLDLRSQVKLAEINLQASRANHAHELLLRDKDLAHMKEEAANALALADLNAAKERDVADREAMGKSYEHDRRAYASEKGADQYAGWFVAVDFARGITRPALTAFLNLVMIVLTGFLCYLLLDHVPELLKADLTVKDRSLLVDTFIRVIDALIFMASTSTMWWFAARGINPRAHRGN